MKLSYFFKNKYGEDVYEALVEGESVLNLKKGNSENLYGRNAISENIPESLLSKELKSKYEWAFDFPGWIGGLKNEPQSINKEIMIIGLEPHIEAWTFQVVYGLRETALGEYKDLNNGNCKNLWENLNKIFTEKNEIEDDFLKKLYITDLCHFAPKGKAFQIKEIKNWKEIRKQCATKYLSDEISLINPKFIVSHGVEAANIVANKILKEIAIPIKWKSPKELKNELEFKYVNLPFISKYEFKGKDLFHIGVPHLASGFTKNFWKKLDFLKFKMVLNDFIKNQTDLN
jgi:hypothetical protein